METMSTRQAAEYLGLAQSTMRVHRVIGSGPAFRKLPNGRIEYRVADVVAFARKRAERAERAERREMLAV